jgi:hypothetical protein
MMVMGLSNGLTPAAVPPLAGCPWMNAPAFGRDVAPLGREVGCHGLCPWGSTLKIGYKDIKRNTQEPMQ